MASMSAGEMGKGGTGPDGGVCFRGCDGLEGKQGKGKRGPMEPRTID